MQDRHLYEYAVIRVVPRVEREEFVNVGVIVFCKRQKFVKMLFEVNEAKLLMLHNDIDNEQLRLNLESFERIAHGAKNGGPIAKLEPDERFRWLTAVRSSVIQTSRPHPGFCLALQDTANQLFNDLVK
ncbi:hypothetical protein AM493_01620 [Flavobacterium akiainvivens]|uniref:DUF3037 domain-containing protein n=1 Tax=Flavobacterium akiainvivens TaxID=1202724 RepID=A0A0M8M7B9_9FLAO|nr:DUF3037 domain-containing protein [Flavobacterium akiainvivens]KOS04883.1 hypothetical protein AM493_01620 [Flavobacterium akiainvivens]SFQ42781.1 Protein of unknown function [Flavobacterium akiainvivens]